MRKMLKERFRLLKNKKGFTLVEVIIALAIFSIFTLLACMMFAVVFNIYNKTNRIDRSMDTQTAAIENGSARINDAVDTSKFTIEFSDTSIQSVTGKQYAAGSEDDAIHIKVFS